mgnify:CR=1 FL=1
MAHILTEITNALSTLGYMEGLFALFFFMMHGWVFFLYHGRISDRQKEINRLAKENRDYRERFTKLLDRHYDVTGKKPEL